MSGNKYEFHETVYVTVKQLAALPQYPWLTESSARHLIHNAEPRVNSRGEKVGGNGLSGAIIRVGRRVLVNLNAFDKWLNGHSIDEGVL